MWHAVNTIKKYGQCTLKHYFKITKQITLIKKNITCRTDKKKDNCLKLVRNQYYKIKQTK